MSRDRAAFWRGWAAAGGLAWAVLVANALGVPNRPALAVVAVGALGLAGWWATGGRR